MVAINLHFVLAALAFASAAAAAPSATSPQGGVTFNAPKVIPSIFQSLGQALGSESFSYTMSLKGQDMEGLTQEMTRIAESGGAWLSKDQLEKYASVSDSGRTAISDYLKSQGIKDSDITFSDLGDEVHIKSSVSQASKMLAAKFETFLFGRDKAPRTKQYTVDASIAQYVQNIYPIADFQEVKVPNLHTQRIDARAIQDRADAPAGCDPTKVTPECLRNVYGTSGFKPSTGTPSNVDVAVMEYIGQYTSQSDLTKFLKQYRPDAAGYKIQVENSMGAINLPILGLTGIEAMLDVETVVSQVYPLQTTVYNVGSVLTQGDIFTLTFNMFIKAKNQPGVITISYGSQESDMTQAQANTMCAAAQKLTALGTTIFISAGDSGVASADESATCPPFAPTYPSGCPYVVSVGATENFTPEKAVGPDVGGFYGGAGISNFFPTPEFQKSALSGYLSSSANVAPKDAYNSTGRAYPDVTAQGSKYVVIANGKSMLVGGTSASAPTFASVFALLNDARKQVGKGRVGWANPTLYKNPSALNDITTGSSLGCGAANTGFNATTGYDLASGLGSPNFAALRTAFGA